MSSTGERLLRKRVELRQSVDECIALLDGELLVTPVRHQDLELLLQELDEHTLRLNELDEEYKDCLVESDDFSDQSYKAECDVIKGFTRRIRLTKAKVNAILYPTPQIGVSVEDTMSTRSNTPMKKNLRLPKISLKRYSGELLEWLGWWAQFKTIHESEEIHVSDKFTYLLLGMKEGSRAHVVVRSFPQSDENYPKAVEALKERFGKTKLLRQVYVRELIKMILDTREKEKTPLGTLHDKLESSLRSLESLGVNTEQMVEFLYPMVESSLPEDTLLAWQRSPSYGRDGSKEVPPMSELDYLMKFLKTEIDHEETRKLARDGFGIHTKDQKKHGGQRAKTDEDECIPTAAGLYSGTAAQKSTCLFCKKSHESQDCRKAQFLTLEERKGIVATSGACFACLQTGHNFRSRSCKFKVRCSSCSRRHFLVLCPDGAQKPNPETQTNQVIPTLKNNLNLSDEVVLGTLMVTVSNPICNKSKQVRILLDTGSHRSYISEKAAKELGLAVQKTVQVNHDLFGGVKVLAQTHKVYDFGMAGLGSKVSFPFTMMDHPWICGPIPRVTRGPWMKELKRRKILFTDLDPSQPSGIDILIGADYYGRILSGRFIPLENGLTAMETVLGWTLIGQTKPMNTTALSVITMTVSCSTITELWNLEIIGIRDPAEVKSSEERERETREHFTRSVKQDEEGRYSVSLPWISPGAQAALPSNYEVAHKRLLSTSKRLDSLQKFDSYDAVFKDWEKEGIISIVTERTEEKGRKFHYLPHGAVFKDSKTTPVRPVFDASCKFGRNPSLNGCLEKGPNFLELIPSILLRFRMGRIGVIADIRKAFLMINVNEEDRDFLRFLWWENKTQTTLKVYQHNRVVFGMNCSPFLLGAVIGHHLQDLHATQPELADRIRNSTYVDNLVTAVDSTEEYEKVKEVATDTFAGAKMELRQWERSGIREDGAVTGVLGLRWEKMMDSLYCDFLPMEIPQKMTKRVILSQIQRIFDPLGFLTPTLLIPKVLLQKAWLEDKQWDSEVTEEVEMKFKQWLDEMALNINHIKVPRSCNEGLQQSSGKFQLHVFGDASKLAYAAVAFLRVDTGAGVKVHLLQAKARVAPVKTVTIPRLELLSCTIASRLSMSVRKALSLEAVPIFHWSDSTTALAWVRRASEWGTFVGNRVKEILELTDTAQWRHVPGELNPADLPSRGLAPGKFAKLRWWEGPDWLKLDSSQWPHAEPEADESQVNREIKTISTLAVISDPTRWYILFNSYAKNLIAMSYVLRFVKNVKEAVRSAKQNKTLRETYKRPSVEEIIRTEKILFKIIQDECFSKKETVVEGLRVERDKEGMVRVRTKLLFRQDSIGFKYPILLPYSHPLVDAFIRDEHVFNCHGGAQLLMGKIREKAWLVQGRRAIQKVLRACVTCRRFDSRKSDVPAIALPEDRVKDATAFEVTGVDLAGPLTLRDGTKAYIVLFTCAVYQCVHLEVTQSLSTEDFLLAFVRFSKRKRRPSTVYSDNGSNFKGAVNLFELIDWHAVLQRTQAESRLALQSSLCTMVGRLVGAAHPFHKGSLEANAGQQ